jgi:predicted dehydrogenase
VQLAVVGAAGRQGLRRLEALSALPACTLRWLVELPEKRQALDGLAERFHCRATTDWRVVVSDPHTDAVVICTPSDYHAAIALFALASGKHVFVEKPLDADLPLAQETVDLARRQKLALHVGLSYRFRDPVKAALAMLAADAIGPVQHVRGVVGHSQFVGVKEHDDRAHFLDGVGSGPLLDLGIHFIDLGRLALGRPPFRRAQGAESRGSLLPHHVPQVETACFVTPDDRSLTIEASYIECRPYMGAQLDIIGSSGRLQVAMAANVVNSVNAVELVTFAGKGCDARAIEQMLSERGLRWTDHRTRETNGIRALWFTFDFPDSCWRDDCKAFIDAVGCPSRPMDNGMDAVESLKLVYAARESARRDGRPVPIEQGLEAPARLISFP